MLEDSTPRPRSQRSAGGLVCRRTQSGARTMTGRLGHHIIAGMLPIDHPPHFRVRIVANPAAGSSGAPGRDLRDDLRRAGGRLAELGWTIDWRTTAGQGDARKLAAQAAAEGVDLVIAAGGDGTFNEVVNGLIGSRVAAAVLPTGTANVLAAQLGMVGVPSTLHRPNLVSAAEALHAGTVRRVDLGRARSQTGDERRFVLWAGIGLDAAIAHEVETTRRELKRLLGPALFGAVGLKQGALHGDGAAAELEIDGQRLSERLLLGVIANIPLYGGAIRVAPAAVMDDGRLDVVLLCGENLLAAVQHLVGQNVRTAVQHLGTVITGRAAQSAPVARTARRVRVVSEPPLPVHLDAEPFGTTPITITIEPAALRLLVPDCAPESLFSGERGIVPTAADAVDDPATKPSRDGRDGAADPG